MFNFFTPQRKCVCSNETLAWLHLAVVHFGPCCASTDSQHISQGTLCHWRLWWTCLQVAACPPLSPEGPTQVHMLAVQRANLWAGKQAAWQWHPGARSALLAAQLSWWEFPVPQLKSCVVRRVSYAAETRSTDVVQLACLAVAWGWPLPCSIKQIHCPVRGGGLQPLV